MWKKYNEELFGILVQVACDSSPPAFKIAAIVDAATDPVSRERFTPDARAGLVRAGIVGGMAILVAAFLIPTASATD